MDIKILGSGCPKCRTLEANTRKALEEMGLDANITKVTKISDITEYGVMMTPSLVINEKVVSSGKVLSPAEIKNFLKN